MITARRLPFDPLLTAMAAGLALAVGAMAYPAFRGNPWSAPGMILILTAGLIALVGLFGFRRAEAGRPASDVAVDLLDVRTMIEPRAAMLAAINGTDEQCQRLLDQCTVVENLIKNDENYIDADIELHKLICEASGNRILINLSYILHTSVKKTFVATSDALRDNNTFVYHRQTVEAIARHDALSAYNSMMCHVCGLREFIARKIKERDGQQ